MKTKVIVLYIIIFFSACNSNNTAVKKTNCDRNVRDDTTFNIAIWKNGDLFVRGKMVKDIINRNILKNISRDSLNYILGTPTECSNSFCNYLVSSMDTIMVNQNYLLLHIKIDSISNIVEDYWLSD